MWLTCRKTQGYDYRSRKMKERCLKLAWKFRLCRRYCYCLSPELLGIDCKKQKPEIDDKIR